MIKPGNLLCSVERVLELIEAASEDIYNGNPE